LKTDRWRPRSGGRITTRLTVGAALVIAATVVFITVLDAREQRNLIRERIVDETLLLVTTLNDELANALYFSDIERLRHLGDITATHAEIESIRIFNPQGRVLVESGSGKFAAGQVEPHLVDSIQRAAGTELLEGDRSLSAVHPILVGGELLGGVLIVHNLDSADAEIEAMIRRHIWEGLLVLLVAVGLSWLLARRMVEPVKELMEVTRRIASGDLDYSVTDRRDDELGDLAEALDAMRRELKEAARRNEEQRS
jgi:methyl-accepting chemotaxis protein